MVGCRHGGELCRWVLVWPAAEIVKNDKTAWKEELDNEADWIDEELVVKLQTVVERKFGADGTARWVKVHFPAGE